jgi:hypothetical protein
MNYLSIGNTWVAEVGGGSIYLSFGFELRLNCGFVKLNGDLLVI